MKYTIHYHSLHHPGLWRTILIWLAGELHRYRASANTFKELARKINDQGVEPGYRAEQTLDNNGCGLDFYPLEPESHNKWSWLTDQKETKIIWGPKTQ